MPEEFSRCLLEPEFRLAYCEISLPAFCWYYLGASFDRAFATGHWQLFNILEREDWEMLWIIGFREFGKTLLVIADILRHIVFKKANFVGIVSADGKKSGNHTYNLAVQLQTNQRLIEDFGQLYFGEKVEKKNKVSKRQSVNDFITTNKVRVTAFSNRSKFKGEVYMEEETGTLYRLDYLMLDDIETIATAKSYVVSQSTIDALDEAFSSMSPASKVVGCFNRVSNSMVLAHLEQKVNRKNILKFEIPLLDAPNLVKDKENILEVAKRPNSINWTSRFVATNKQKEIINKFAKSKRFYVDSVENLIHKYGIATFMREYMNQPQEISETFVEKEWIKNNYYEKLPKGVKYVVSIDPQSGMTKKSDEFAITTLAYLPQTPERFVVSQIAGRGSPLLQSKLFIQACLDCGSDLTVGGVEVIKTQTAVYQNVLDWRDGKIKIDGLKDCAQEFPVVIQRTMRDKEDRLNNFLPAFSRGEIHLPAPTRTDNLYELEEQLIFFTNLPHDDRADSLVLALELVRMRDKRKISKDKSEKNRKQSQTVFGNVWNEVF